MITTVCCHRGMKDGAFSEVERHRLRLLMPHLSRSLGVLQRLRDAEFKVAANLAALDLLKAGVLLIGSEHQVVFANKRALSILREGDGLRLRHHPGRKSYDTLEATDPRAQDGLDTAISTALSPDILTTPHFSHAIPIKRISSHKSYALNFSSLALNNEFGTGSEIPRAIIFVTETGQPLSIDKSWLHTAYKLAPAEIRIAMMLVEGDASLKIAESIGVSLNTVNTQIQNIYSKTGVNSRAKLVRLFLSLSQTSFDSPVAESNRTNTIEAI